MKLCACSPGCPAVVKGKGKYALGHNPKSRNHVPGILLKLKAKEKSINTRRDE